MFDDLYLGEGEMITIDRCPPFCIECRGLNFQFINDWESIDFDGENILVYVEYFTCLNCGEEVEASHPNYHPLEDAYREYKRRTGKEWNGHASTTDAG